MKNMYLLSLLVLAMICGMNPVSANTYAVISPLDLTINDSGCLRWAMHKAEMNPGPDTVAFNIAGPLPIIMNIFSPLSLDSANYNGDGTFINGGSQPAPVVYGTAPRIVLKGPGPQPTCLMIHARNVKVTGLCITNWQQFGIAIMPGADGFIIGDSAHGNFICNITLASANGISITAAGNGKIQGNRIGVDTSGMTSQPTGSGIIISGALSNHILIGGSFNGQGNIISGQRNQSKNIIVDGGKNISIIGNIIGCNRLGGLIDSANTLIGINLKNGADSCIIGGSNPNEGNIIAYNMETLAFAGGGVIVDGSNFARISHNQIYCNGHSGGIQLINNGNGNYAAPLIMSANSGGAVGTGLAGSVIELFYNNSGCALSTQTCSGAVYAGTTTVDIFGNWAYVGYLDAAFSLTATAADPVSGNTSPFAPCALILFTTDVPSVTPYGSYSVYPNPFNTFTQIKVDNSLLNAGCVLTITDISGRELRSINIINPTTEINKEEMAAGIYFYNLITREGKAGSGKLVIQ